MALSADVNQSILCDELDLPSLLNGSNHLDLSFSTFFCH